MEREGGIAGERIIAYASRIDVMKIPLPRTHRHRAQGAKLDEFSMCKKKT